MLYLLKFECVFALKIWERVGEWVTPAMEEWRYEEDCREKLIMKSAQVGMVELFCTIFWLLWHNRNKCFHNDHCDLPQVLKTKANKIVEECISRKSQLQGQSLATRTISWSPPLLFTLKVNTDAAYDQASKQAKLGVVIRDHYRKVLVCALKKVQADNPLHAEMLAMELGLKMACGKGFSKVIIEILTYGC